MNGEVQSSVLSSSSSSNGRMNRKEKSFLFLTTQPCWHRKWKQETLQNSAGLCLITRTSKSTDCIIIIIITVWFFHHTAFHLKLRMNEEGLSSFGSWRVPTCISCHRQQIGKSNCCLLITTSRKSSAQCFKIIIIIISG